MATHERRYREAAFRSTATGEVIATGPCHDLGALPGGFEADLEQWEAGFTDDAGRFLTRCEAARAIGLEGRLESRSYFSGDPRPTLEAGHREAWIGLQGPASASRPSAGRLPR